MSWSDAARAWIAAQVPGRIERVEVVRERVWSSNWRVRSTDGAFWFKRNHPDLRQEAPLSTLLAERVSDLVAAPIATNPDERWLLFPDFGPTLSAMSAEGKPARYIALGRVMAQVQRAVSSEEVAGVGLTTFAPGAFADIIADHLDYCAVLPDGHPLRFGRDERATILRAADGVATRWDALGAPPRLGLDHNDLHLGNAFAGPRIGDWGDAVLGHPFCTMRTLVVVSHKMYGREISDEVRRAYLAEWGDPDELAPELDLSTQLAVAQRFHAWRRMDSPEGLEEHADYVRPLLLRLGDPAETLETP